MSERTFGKVYLSWKEEKKEFVKRSTLSVYTLLAEKHLLPVFGSFTDIREKDVQGFVLKKIAEGLSHKSVKDIMIVLKMVMRFGIKTGWAVNVEWDIRFPKEHRKLGLKVLTPSEQRRIMDFLSQHMSYRNLGIYICLSTGMRIGEICALKWSDINVKERIISVQRTIERIYITDDNCRHTEVIVGPPKTVNSIREIPISMQLIKVLRPIMKIVHADGYVLTNDTKPLEPRLYRNYYNNMIRNHNLPYINFHGLRHSFATRCIESRCDYKTVSMILGHANITTTMNLYVHPGNDQKRKCIDKMMRMLC